MRRACVHRCIETLNKEDTSAIFSPYLIKKARVHPHDQRLGCTHDKVWALEEIGICSWRRLRAGKGDTRHLKLWTAIGDP